MGTKKPCRDHLGNEYPSVPEMCAAYGIPFSTYTGRLSRGWTLEQALTVATETTAPKVNPRKEKVHDHEGNEFVSIGAMCRHWGIDEKVYWSRKRLLGWPLDKILTEPVRDTAANAISVEDHEGTRFGSISEMCRHWGIGLSTYRERRRRGWDVGRALTGEEIKLETDPVPCRDHEGREYPSKNAMCAAWGVTRYCYDSRITMGWSLEDALTKKHVVNAKPCADHTGKPFPASVYMALYLGFPKYAFHNRKDPSSGIPGLAAKYWRDRQCGGMRVDRCLEFPWFLASDRRGPFIASFGRILDEYHKDGFSPLPETAVKDPYLSVIRPLEWPWYLCLVDGCQAVLGYDKLVQLHRDSNFGLSRPEREEDT